MRDHQTFFRFPFSAGKRAATLLCCLGALSCSAAPAAAAGINCAKAATDVEKTICADSELGKLDDALAKLYTRTLISSGDTDAAVAGERDWLKNVRDKCGAADCLNAAYHARIKQLARGFVSFDCNRAATPVELSICGDDMLQYDDIQLAQAYRRLKGVSGQSKELVADQKHWLEQVRDKCENRDCLASSMHQRTDALKQQFSTLFEQTKEKLGYTRQAFYYDMMHWPNDPNRIIVVIASQASASQAAGSPDADTSPKPDEDFGIDLYVIDSASRNVLQHGTDSITSDAVQLRDLNLDATDYVTRLGAPVFGMATSYDHYGCAGYSRNAIRLYAASGKTIKGVLPEIATSTSASMCQTDCEYSSSRSDLQFTGVAGQHYPDLLIRVKYKDAVGDPNAPQGACKITRTQREYQLHFDGTQYPAPKEIGY